MSRDFSGLCSFFYDGGDWSDVIFDWDTTPGAKCVNQPSSFCIRFSKLGKILLPFN